jgi:hypothetical protein
MSNFRLTWDVEEIAGIEEGLCKRDHHHHHHHYYNYNDLPVTLTLTLRHNLKFSIDQGR